jgi:hypothetical protein
MIRSWAVFFALVSAMVVSMHCIALAEIKEEARWSIDFGEISISEALDQLTKVTGIKIFTKTPLSHRISPKRYRNQSIEQILKDLLKNVNFAAVWHYSERGIESIGILAFDRARAESNSIVSNVKRVGSGLERGEGIKEPSAEPEETEGSEADDRDEELGKSSKEDTSSPDSSDAQLEPTTGSSRGEEGLPKDQQNEGKE